MTHYVDLILRPDAESTSSHLMNALFGRLHLALVAQHSERIGISFPAVRPERQGLGGHLRLHGDDVDLIGLMKTPWLSALRDHVQTSNVLSVPHDAPHRVVSRVQAKSSAERLRRRYMRRHGGDAAQAIQSIPDAVSKQLDLPYVQVRSRSTAQAFRLFIRHGELLDAMTLGTFSAYGLSAGGSVPWF